MSRIRYYIDGSPSCFERIDALAAGQKLFCLADANSYAHCFSVLEAHLDSSIHPIQIPAGEEKKNLDTCRQLWERLMEEGAERDSVMIALGGGMITDVGGFVAAAYRRGMPSVLVPTTLLGMVDAAIGGKNGVDLKGYKNMIGTVRQPDEVLIHPPFLKTLDDRQLKAGYAEMLKHAVLDGHELLDRVRGAELSDRSGMEAILPDVVEVKRSIVERDPRESGDRERLNFGHTVGHAVETLSMESDGPLLHGEAVAVGMLVEGLISEEVAGLPPKELQVLTESVLERFSLPELPRDDEILRTMEKDKKRKGGRTRFVLLERIGKAVPGWTPEEAPIKKAFQQYRKLV